MVKKIDRGKNNEGRKNSSFCEKRGLRPNSTASCSPIYPLIHEKPLTTLQLDYKKFLISSKRINRKYLQCLNAPESHPSDRPGRLAPTYCVPEVTVKKGCSLQDQILQQHSRFGEGRGGIDALSRCDSPPLSPFGE